MLPAQSAFTAPPSEQLTAARSTSTPVTFSTLIGVLWPIYAAYSLRRGYGMQISSRAKKKHRQRGPRSTEQGCSAEATDIPHFRHRPAKTDEAVEHRGLRSPCNNTVAHGQRGRSGSSSS